MPARYRHSSNLKFLGFLAAVLILLAGAALYFKPHLGSTASAAYTVKLHFGEELDLQKMMVGYGYPYFPPLKFKLDSLTCGNPPQYTYEVYCADRGGSPYGTIPVGLSNLIIQNPSGTCITYNDQLASTYMNYIQVTSLTPWQGTPDSATATTFQCNGANWNGAWNIGFTFAGGPSETQWKVPPSSYDLPPPTDTCSYQTTVCWVGGPSVRNKVCNGQPVTNEVCPVAPTPTQPPSSPCGIGTVYDQASNSCVLAPAPQPPASVPPAPAAPAPSTATSQCGFPNHLNDKTGVCELDMGLAGLLVAAAAAIIFGIAYLWKHPRL